LEAETKKIMEAKTFRLVDPYYSWGNHDYDWVNRKIKENICRYDSGLCNRLFTWEIAYRLVKKENKDRKILVQKRIFPETELIHLPNTETIDYFSETNPLNYSGDSERLFHLSVLDTEKNEVSMAQPLYVKDIVEKDFNFDSNHIYNNWKFYQDGNHEDIFGIKIKDKNIENRLKSHGSFVGIQLRRGNGVRIYKDDIKSFPKDMQKDYLNFRKKIDCVLPVVDFIANQPYINLIRQILKINPQQRFFISNDLPDEFLDFLYSEFGTHHIVSKKDYREEFTKYYESKGIDITSLQNYCNGLDNIIDLFGLSFTPFTISSSQSTWGEFARNYKGPFKYRNIPNFNGNNIDEITSMYKQFYKEYRDRLHEDASIINQLESRII
jgi:hypothetical protein